MSYKNTFIRVSEDCPALQSEIPVIKGDKKTIHRIQYELLTQHPYRYDHERLIFEVYLERNGLQNRLSNDDRQQLWDQLFSKGHPCLRASALIKRYGFGAHYDDEGKIALYPMESDEYREFEEDPGIQKFNGMRSSR